MKYFLLAILFFSMISSIYGKEVEFCLFSNADCSNKDKSKKKIEFLNNSNKGEKKQLFIL